MSASVGTLKNHFTGNVIHSKMDGNGHYVCQVIGFNIVFMIITNLNGYNTNTENKSLPDSVEQQVLLWLNKCPNAFLLIGGNFNVVINNEIDRWSPKYQLKCLFKALYAKT